MEGDCPPGESDLPRAMWELRQRIVEPGQPASWWKERAQVVHLDTTCLNQLYTVYTQFAQGMTVFSRDGVYRRISAHIAGISVYIGVSGRISAYIDVYRYTSAHIGVYQRISAYSGACRHISACSACIGLPQRVAPAEHRTYQIKSSQVKSSLPW